jgi:ATP-dependent RNA helicase RhlE
VHRIGRTGRAGETGQALSLVSADEYSQLQGIERILKTKLERIIVDDFEPEHNVPLTGVSAGMAKKPHRMSTHPSRKKPITDRSKNNPQARRRR